MVDGQLGGKRDNPTPTLLAQRIPLPVSHLHQTADGRVAKSFEAISGVAVRSQFTFANIERCCCKQNGAEHQSQTGCQTEYADQNEYFETGNAGEHQVEDSTTAVLRSKQSDQNGGVGQAAVPEDAVATFGSVAQ